MHAYVNAMFHYLYTNLYVLLRMVQLGARSGIRKLMLLYIVCDFGSHIDY
jgi:hypothetical protein